MKPLTLFWMTMQLTYATTLGILVLMVVQLRKQLTQLRQEVASMRDLLKTFVA